MAETKTQGEPSMEEILASIRRIIAEDGEEKQEPAVVAASDEILELTEIVEQEPAAEEPARDNPAPGPAPGAAAPAAADLSDRLISAGAAATSVAALAQLASLSGREQRRDGIVAVGNGQLTIEQLVRELLRPMLRDWIDDNLPGLVERLVKEEISRMVRDAQQR